MRRFVWKWIVSALLVVFAAAIWWWPPRPARSPVNPAPVKVELLPFSETPPAWDGSFPYLVITPTHQDARPKFSYSLSQVKPTLRHDSPVNNFEVDLHTGRFILRQTDLFVPDVMPLSLTRTYITWDYHSRAFGAGTNHPYDICPTGSRYPYTYMDINLEDFYQVHMLRISKGTGYADAVFRHSDTASEFYGAQVSWNGKGWTMSFRDGRKIYFPESYNAKTYAQGAAIAMADGEGHRIELKRSPARNLDQLTSPSGRTITFHYDADHIIEARDSDGNVRKYTYDTAGHVETVSDETQVLYRFEYAPLMREKGYDPWMMTRVIDGNWNVLLENQYQSGRVVKQRLADGQVFRYEYKLNDRDVLETTVTLPSGKKKFLAFRDGILVEQNEH